MKAETQYEIQNTIFMQIIVKWWHCQIHLGHLTILPICSPQFSPTKEY